MSDVTGGSIQEAGKSGAHPRIIELTDENGGPYLVSWAHATEAEREAWMVRRVADEELVRVVRATMTPTGALLLLLGLDRVLAMEPKNVAEDLVDDSINRCRLLRAFGDLRQFAEEVEAALAECRDER